jgi:hypothetical protein
MELILNYFLSETPFVSRIWGEGIWKQYSLKEKIQNFGNDLEMQYAMNAWWKFYIWKFGMLHE